MRITMIGAGRLGTHLARALHKAGHDIAQVYSRTMASASPIAAETKAEAICHLGDLRNDADIYILSVSDNALPQLLPTICEGRDGKLFLHTAGSVSIAIFKGITSRYGVLYPLQTFSKQWDINFRTIPCFIEGNTEEATYAVEELAKTLCTRIVRLSSDRRKYLHLAAVFACNFTNHCYTLAANILEKQDISFDALLPLIAETADKVNRLSPQEAQTGPAVRYDKNIICAQAELLSDNTTTKALYELMSKSINEEQTKYRKKND